MDKNILTNRFCGVFVCAAMLFVGQSFAAWDGQESVRPEQDAKGVFLIKSEANLAWISDSTNANYQILTSSRQYLINVRLEADLDMGNELFVPICGGSGDKKFQGTFDGNGHTISNLRINGSEIAAKTKQAKYAQNVGFVGAMSGGTIKNLVLENVDLQSSSNIGLVGSTNQISVGAFVGWQENGLIENCVASGIISTSGEGQGVGGIVGNVHKGTIRNCLSEVSIHVSGIDAQVGGIIGLVKKSNTVTVQSCVYAGSTLENTANGAVGAIVGQQLDGNTKLQIKDSYYDSDVAKSGVGSIKTIANVTDKSNGVKELNVDEYVCTLNGGKIENGECNKNSPWSVGMSGVSLNGSDGYKVVFNAKSGAFGENAKTKKIIANGAKITAEEISIPTHTDSAFAGWSLNKNATEPDEDLGAVSGQTTVYAVWYPIYKITFSAAPGKYTDNETEKYVYVAKNDKISVDGFEVPFSYTNKENVKFYFTGWALSENAPEKDTLHVLPTATENMTLYAVWTPAVTYTVTYNDNGHGKTKVDFVRVENKHKTDKPVDPEADAGYEFVDWYIEPECENKFDFDTEIEENWTLYAKWNAKEFAIDYVLDGGVNSKDNPSKYTIESETIVLAAPVKNGYDFAGWFYDKNFSEKASQITQGSTGAKTLYAKWTEKTYTISYLAGTDAYGTVSSEKKKHGASIKLKGEGIFTRDGYVQDGWSLKNNDEKNFTLGAIYSNDADIKLYPHWVKASSVRVTHYGAVTVYEYVDDKTVAEIDGDYTGPDTVDISDVHVDEVVFIRKFEVGKMSTIMLPFAIDTSKVTGGTFYRFKRVEGEEGSRKVYVGKIKTEQMAASTPYLVMPTASEITFEGNVIFNTDVEPAENLTNGAWELKGVYAYTEFGELIENNKNDDFYGFAAQERDGAKVGQFVKLGNAKSPALRAYLVEHKGVALAKSVGETLGSRNWAFANEIDVVIVDEEDNVVETGKLNTVTGEFRMDHWFDLNGRKLNAKPTTRGTYYHNGERVIVK